MKRKISNLLLSLCCAFSMIPMASMPVYADNTPDVIYSTIEGSGVEIGLNNAIYPVTSSSTRTWYCNDVLVSVDGTNIRDLSEGQSAKLKMATTTTANHMQNYKVVDTTNPKPAGEIKANQTARVYVISQANYSEATLSTKELKATVGEEVYAKDITLYIDSTSYPNFQPLKFVVGGNKLDKITVEEGSKTYTLTDTVLNKTVSLNVVGTIDNEVPKISSLVITDGKADKYATTKTLEVAASDNVALADECYYWEDNPNL